jgi:hypothetical protein
MLTGRDALSGSAPLVAPKAQGMVSSPYLLFPSRPLSLPFPITFFRWLEANRAEREASQGRAHFARSSERSADP